KSRKPGDLPFQENTSVGRGAPVSRSDRISGSQSDELPFSITAPHKFFKGAESEYGFGYYGDIAQPRQQPKKRFP
ncbi:hypothetical protein, partial [Agrobacterium sp.]|uniref:hypothetical protein n=1 Tax=Agrobacterium sp. TaxID=361 RepID=UPI0028A5BA77